VSRVTDHSALHVVGMHGMGDNLHQRAAIRQLMLTRTVYLETPWPCIYHDLVGDRLKLIKKPTALRTQAKNLQREESKYDVVAPPPGIASTRVWYSGDEVRRAGGSVFVAMMRNVGCILEGADFRLPVPMMWRADLRELLDVDRITKPILVYRPLVERKEWSGCATRNPEIYAYYELLQLIRPLFHVVSVADLVPGVEWIAGKQIVADTEFHHGELTFEMLAALVQEAALTFCSPGFATILSQAVGTPSVCVFGGYENSQSFSFGSRFAPYLGIDPINPCTCFSHTHRCQKTIDVPRAMTRLLSYVEECLHGYDSAAERRADARQLELAFEAVHEPKRAGDADLANRVRAATMRR